MHAVRCGRRRCKESHKFSYDYYFVTMKLTNTLLLLQVASAEFIRLGSSASADTQPAPAGEFDARVGIFYCSGPEKKHTPLVAGYIANATGLLATDVDDADPNFNFDQFDSIIIGGPTYNTGSVDHRSVTKMDDWLYEVLPNIDISGKNIAIFATGKHWYEKTHDDGTPYLAGYGNNFGDVAGELYDRLSEKGTTVFGFTVPNHDTSTGGYNFTRSKAIRNGMFVGMMVHEKEKPAELQEARANKWVEQLRNEGFFTVKSTDRRAEDGTNTE